MDILNDYTIMSMIMNKELCFYNPSRNYVKNVGKIVFLMMEVKEKIVERYTTKNEVL